MLITYAVVYASQIPLHVGGHDVNPFELMKCGFVLAHYHLFEGVAVLA